MTKLEEGFIRGLKRAAEIVRETENAAQGVGESYSAEFVGKAARRIDEELYKRLDGAVTTEIDL